MVDGKVLADGQSAPSPDGCNTCTCNKGELLCSQSPCLVDTCEDEVCYPAGSCLSDGNLVLPDETIMAPDGCNTCSCSSGKLECTSNACGTGCFAPEPFDDLDCTDGEKVEIHWHHARAGYCRAKEVTRCNRALMDGYFRSSEECDAACPNDTGLGCVVGGELYAHGSAIKDPFSCNSCWCHNGGTGECTQGGCSTPCPEGTAPGRQCGMCGQDGRCQAIETTCLPVCGVDGDAPCASGGCIDGLCVTACQ